MTQVTINEILHCPPVFGIFGSERDVVEVAYRYTFSAAAGSEFAQEVLDEYYETGEMPSWFTRWLEEVFPDENGADR